MNFAKSCLIILVGLCLLVVTGGTANAAGLITVTAPNTAVTWKAGTLKKITWDYSGTVGSMVKIELLKAGGLLKVIRTSAPVGTAGKGAFSWIIPPTLSAGTDYQIRVKSVADPAISDLSDTTFAITAAAPLTVITPNGGENWKTGETGRSSGRTSRR